MTVIECHLYRLGLGLAMINLYAKFEEVFISIRYDDMKCDAECRKWGGLGS